MSAPARVYPQPWRQVPGFTRPRWERVLSPTARAVVQQLDVFGPITWTILDGRQMLDGGDALSVPSAKRAATIAAKKVVM